MPNMSLPTFVEAAARASIILASTGLVAAALRRSSASARHLVWMLGLLSALLVPALSLAVPKVELPLVKLPAASTEIAEGTQEQRTIGHSSSSLRETGTPARARANANPSSSSATPSSGTPLLRVEADPLAPSSPSPLSLSTLALLVWGVGASVVIARLLLGLIAVQWMSRRTRAVSDGPWVALAHDLAAGLGLTNVRFVQSDTASMPMAWGLMRASVVMPADADAWPAHRLRVVLLHELAHVKRRDCLTHVVAQIVCAAYWFNPLAWIAVRRLRSERERACDDLVLQAGTRSSDYADELLDIARVMQSQRFPAVLAGASLAMAHRSQLEGRLMAILDPNVPRRGLTRARAAAAAGIFVALILSVASVQPWAEERAVVKGAITDAQAPVEKPIEASPGQAASDVRANARAEDRRQTAVQDRVQTQLQGRVHSEVTDIIADTAGQVVGGVVSGVIDGVAEGIAGGVAGGVAGAVPGNLLVRPNPNPNPNPNPDSGQGDKDKDRDKDKDKVKADPRVVAALMDALKDSDKEVRETAMQTLVRMRDPRMFEPLVAALKDTSPDVREQAVFGLGQLRDPRAIDALTGVLHDSNPDVRQQAIFALGQFRDKRTVEPFISALKDENPDVRQQAAFGLGQLREPRALEALVVALKDNNADVRQQAAFSLGQLRDPRAIDGLTAAMKDGNADVRKQAAFALGQIRY